MSHLATVSYLLGDKYSVLLSREETLFIAGSEDVGYGSWTPSNASLVAEETVRFRDVYNTLRVAPLVADSPNTEFSIAHEPKIVDPLLAEDRLAFHTFINPLVEMDVSITIEDSNGQSVTTEYLTLPPNTWTLVKSGLLFVTNQTSTLRAFTTINFRSDESLNHVHIAHPVLTNYFGFTENLFLREVMTYLPRFLIETDEAQENPTFPMFRLMDLGLAYADHGYRQAQEFIYSDIASGFSDSDDSTKSKLVNPEVADVTYLPWLGQFVGVSRKTSRSGATPWGNLPTTWAEMHTSIDPDADITYSISSIDVSGATLTATPTSLSAGDTVSISGTTNYDGQYLIESISSNTLVLNPAIDEATESTGTVTLVDTSWIEIEQYDTQDSNYISSQRNLATTARTGHNAGTKQAIIDTLESFLLGDKWYSYSANPLSNPWVISLQTLTSETPGGVTGEQSDLVIFELAPVKPMGFSIVHECIESA